MNQSSTDHIPDPAYRSLYRLGGVAAFLVAFLTLAEVIAFMLVPQPLDMREWFDLFQAAPLTGLMEFWGLEYLMYGMFVLVFLGLYFALRETDKGTTALTLVLALLGAAIFFATSNPFSMLTLSRKYAAASGAADRTALLAAGEVLLANTNQRGIGGFNMGLFLVSLAGLTAAIVMRKSAVFPKRTAALGLWAFIFSLADYLRQIITDNVLIALGVILPGAVLLILWFIQVGNHLLKLTRPNA
jgi:hypothetical protein